MTRKVGATASTPRVCAEGALDACLKVATNAHTNTWPSESEKNAKEEQNPQAMVSELCASVARAQCDNDHCAHTPFIPGRSCNTHGAHHMQHVAQLRCGSAWAKTKQNSYDEANDVLDERLGATCQGNNHAIDS